MGPNRGSGAVSVAFVSHHFDKMNWKHFCFAALLVGAALVKYGAPLFSVLLGIAAMAAVNVARARRHGVGRAR